MKSSILRKLRLCRLIQPCWIAGLTLLGQIAAAGADLPAEQVEFFESKIRPILAQDCYECHNSKDKAKGGLVLDHRVAWQRGGDSGEVINPGNPGDSLLLKVIRHEIDDLKMPKAGAKLETEVVADFEKWIAMGAPDPRDEPPSDEQLAADTDWEAIRERRQSWWSFQPIETPEVPRVEGVEDPVDRFVRAAVAEAELTPSAPADPRTLVRRLYFNLIGLPPNPEQVASFLDRYGKDSRAAAEEEVDGLLGSAAFGEKWARHWMDWTRYADTHGSEGDPAIPNAFLYRDYLIRALNDDVPYDRMVLEHFAGDLLDDPRINESLELNESALGIGHLRMVFHGFAPTDALDELVRFTDDQINTTTKAFLGMTVSCARCHNHKFDPISQADFYALFGMFRSSRPAMIAADVPGKLERNRAELAELKQKVHSALAEDWSKTPPSFAVSKRISEAEKPGELLHPLFLLQRDGKDPESFAKAWQQIRANFEKEKAERAEHRGRDYQMHWNAASMEDYETWFREGEGLAEKPSPAGEFAIAAEGEKALLGIYPSGVYSHGLSTKHRAILASPPIDLDGKYDLWMRVAGNGQATARYAVQNYPRSGTVFPVRDLKEGQWQWAKFERLDYWDGDRIHLEVATAADQPLLARLGNDRSWFGIREAVLMEKGGPKPPAEPREIFDPVFEAIGEAPKSIEEVVAGYEKALQAAISGWRSGALSDSQALFLDACLRLGLLPGQIAELNAAGPLIAQYRQIEARVPTPTRAPGVLETRGYDQALFTRGDHKKPGDPVPRRFLEAIDATPYETELSGRLEFARDLLRDDNPLTRRVIVNRIWHHLFGNGLVASADNFGRMGEAPSHPELLDYLAVRFSDDHEWSLKKLIRELVLTETWRQSSDPISKDEVERIDPDNRLLSHFNIRRMEAEAIRDSLLAIGGNLDLENRWGPSVAGNSTRRSVYVRSIRNNMDPFLTAFDAPVPASTVGKRDSTNVPAQSLTMLNDSFVVAQAGSFAQQVVRDNPEVGDDAVIGEMFSRALARPATEAEIAKGKWFLAALAKNHADTQKVIDELESLVAEKRTVLTSIVDPVRSRLLANRKAALKGAKPEAVDLKPIASWNFETDLKDSIGSMHGEFRGNGEGRLEGGAVSVSDSSLVATKPLDRDLGEKTLEAIVQLDTLDQRAGGVMTVQDLQGGAFDAIVFAEKRANRWLAGSNGFTRTLDFDGTDESEAAKKPVHLAWVYQADGNIRAYRNGQPYGHPIRKTKLHTFKAGETQVLFGMRHGIRPAGGRSLRGRILEARLYDRALSPGEVVAAAKGDPLFVSEREVLEALSESQRVERDELDAAIAKLDNELINWRQQASDAPVEQRKWRDLAHAIFNLKEFIYIR